ncbi:hypothetical protein HZS_7739 [Henneguya salminicola]|nr:hypothetical protein HZS_7739 [Henneguya salminicola]
MTCFFLVQSHTFIDATFRFASRPSSQSQIVMFRGHEKNQFAPCYFLEYLWTPRHIAVDFEMGLIKAIKYEFSESLIVGCYLTPKASDTYTIIMNLTI